MRKIVAAAVLAAACGPALVAEAPPPPPEPSPVASVAPEPSASPAALAAVTPEPERPRVLATVGATVFSVVASPARLLVEAAIDDADSDLVAAQVAADVADVEREFGRSFAHRPVVYVFATADSYARGMARIFGYPEPAARYIAESSVAFFEPPLRIIGVHWEAIRDRRPVAAIRHELTHDMTLDACGAFCHLVPAWLNEGQARLAEALVPGSEMRLARVRYEAASMALTGTLIPLADLASQYAWNSLTDWAGYYKYQQAARAVELLRDDVGGPAPIARVYERIARGETIAQAYAALTGRSFDAFVAGLPPRFAAVAPAPGIAVTRSDGIPRSGYLLHGFAPSSDVAVTLAGARATVTWTVTVSPFGAAFEAVPSELPRGRYVIGATGGGVTATATVTKR